MDDTNLIMLISIFMDNHKWNIVEYLAERILAYGENKYALRTLGECYENRDEEPKKLEVWDRLIRVDYEEADIVKILGEKREAAGDLAAAVDYYKKAIHRFINKKQFASVKELWDKLIKLSPEDIDFFFHIEGRIARALNGERAASLLVTLIPHYKEKEDWNTSIDILKKVLAYDSKNNAARKDIIECYRKKYAGHSQLEEYIKISNLTQNWRSVHEALADFEKHIGFDTGNYVFHRSWGIGRISASKDDTFTIDFANKTSHKMSLKMAVSALEVLSAEHIWVLKRTLPKEELARKVKDDAAWALRTIIKSFGNLADMKKIKAELVPDVLTAGEWSRWNTEARSILKKDSAFGNLPDKIDQFMVREKPISFEEKTFNKFKAEKGFFERVKTIEDYIQAGHAEPDSDWFTEMFAYFTGFLKGYTAVSETVISSWLLLQKIIARYPFLSIGVQTTFEELFAKIEKLEETFSRIEDPEIRKEFLISVKKNVEGWPGVFTRLFHLFPARFIVDELVASSNWDALTTMVTGVISRYRELRDAFVWVAKNLLGERWLERMNVSREKIYIGLIHLLDLTYRDIANKQNASANRKTNRQIQEYLFDEGKLLDFLMAADRDSITRLYTLVDDVKELDPADQAPAEAPDQGEAPGLPFPGRAGSGEGEPRAPGDARQLRAQAAGPEESHRRGDPRELQGDRRGHGQGRPAGERGVQGSAGKAGDAEGDRLAAEGGGPAGADLQRERGEDGPDHLRDEGRLEQPQERAGGGVRDPRTVGVQPDTKRDLLPLSAGHVPVGPPPRGGAEVHHQPERVPLHGGAHREGGPEEPMKTPGATGSRDGRRSTGGAKRPGEALRAALRPRAALIVLVLAFAFLLGGGRAQAAQNLDLVVLVDTSESMFPYFDDLMHYLVQDLLTTRLHRGDTFHLISFSSIPEVELSLEVNSDEAARQAFSRVLLLHALGRYTDLVGAMQFLYKYTKELPETNPKQIIIITDGIHDPPPGSPNAVDAATVQASILAVTQAMRKEGWAVSILKVPPVPAPEDQGMKSYLGDIAATLGVPVVPYPTRDKEHVTGVTTGYPTLIFPAALGKVGTRFSAPFRVKNWKTEPIIVQLSSVQSDGSELLDRKVSVTVPAGVEAALDVPLRLPASYPQGQHDAQVQLIFNDDLRISPTEGTISFTFTGKGGLPIPRLTILYVIIIVLALGLIFLLVRLFLSLGKKLADAPLSGMSRRQVFDG